MRSFLVAIVVCLLAPALLRAEELRGSVTKVDAGRNMLTLKVGERERTVQCDPKCRVTMMMESRRAFPRRTSVQEYLTSLNQVPAGAMVTVMLNDQEMATSIQTDRISDTSATAGGRRLLRMRR